MKYKNYADIHPREIADKSKKQNLIDAIQMSLLVESDAVHRNTKVFNTNRYSATSRLLDYEDLKNRARLIKEKAINDLPSLIDNLKKKIESKGGHFFLAENSKEATEYIKNICSKKNAKLVVKAKSITSEEIRLNEVLEAADIKVAETDLAEFILQISKEQPSHNVAPALHQSRERISKLFKENFEVDVPLESGEDLTKFARDILREKFLNADIGISGANCISADTGSILLVESEGNIRLTTHLPATHIAIAGIEKIIHKFSDLSVFIELLAASGTGQSLTSYTNILTPPLQNPILNLNGRDDKVRDFYLVLIDNGRMLMREDPVLHESLYCIRCSACMNVCANFQSLGGHAFGGECYTGGIGGAWTAGTSGDIKKARFAELCTGCSRCIPNCPVRIDIPRLNTEIKNRLIKEEGGLKIQKSFFGNFSKLAKIASISPNVSNFLGNLPFSRTLLEKTIGFKKERPLPKFSHKTLEKLYGEYIQKNGSSKKFEKKVILFPDVFTNYNNAEIGMSVVRVFNKLGIEVLLSKSLDDGRASLSQGLVDQARANAIKVAKEFEKLIDDGYEIIISEPSVLTMFRYEYEKLISDSVLFEKIKSKCYDPFEYLNLNKHYLALINKNEKLIDGEIVYHGHCQLKSIGLGKEVPKLFSIIGIKLIETSAECCGMAGSFGYKKDYYDLSKKVGEHLGNEITGKNPHIIIASGTSCREQISDELKQEVFHPIEVFEKHLL